MSDPDVATYVFIHYEDLLTLAERTAHIIVALGFPRRPSEVYPEVPHWVWDEELLESYWWGRDMDAMAAMEETPEVREMVALGEEAFRRAVVERVLREHGQQVVLNRCPCCGGLCRTPQARQCFRCGHDWH